MSAIPPELISEIFLRLPVKPLLRFRSVSKHYCTLIDSPDFIKRHLNHSIITKSNRSLYMGGGYNLYSLDYTELKTPIKLDIPFKTAITVDSLFNIPRFYEHNNAEIVGSCNGLLLLRINEITLFNSATREYRVLPGSPIDYLKPSGPPMLVCNIFGFGYDSVNDDYKVIKVIEFKDMDSRLIGNETKIYSLKSNSWRMVQKFPYCLPSSSKRVWWAHLNGRLHSVVNTSTDANSPEIKIVAFDLATEQCHSIPLPDGLDRSYRDITVEVFEGFLCVRATYEHYGTVIWVMRVYEVKDLWVKLLSIGPPLVGRESIIYPLGLLRNGGEVLLTCNYKWLICYDLERKSIRTVPFLVPPDQYYIEVCIDSLVPLGGTKKCLDQQGSQGSEVEESRRKSGQE